MLPTQHLQLLMLLAGSKGGGGQLHVEGEDWTHKLGGAACDTLVLAVTFRTTGPLNSRSRKPPKEQK